MSAAPDPNSLRFRPPPTELLPAALWALRRAFAAGKPLEGPTPPPADAVKWASRLGLAERIGALVPRSVLLRELGGPPARELLATAHRAAARNLLLRELAEQVVGAATERGIAIVLLKGMALLVTLPDLDLRRPLADVDLLSEAGAARELATALTAAGWERSEVHESSHHLPALHHPRLGTLEIHTHLPGVGRTAMSPATATDLLAAGVCSPAGEAKGALVPARPVLAAHAIAHALVQGAYSPRGYPLLRVIADLSDLAGEGSDAGSLVDSAAPWLADSVSRRELDALASLTRILAEGTLPEADADAARILAHVAAAHLNPDYRRQLDLTALGTALRRGEWLKLRRRGWRPASLARLFRIGWSGLTRRLRGGAAEAIL